MHLSIQPLGMNVFFPMQQGIPWDGIQAVKPIFPHLLIVLHIGISDSALPSLTLLAAG